MTAGHTCLTAETGPAPTLTQPHDRSPDAQVQPPARSAARTAEGRQTHQDKLGQASQAANAGETTETLTTLPKPAASRATKTGPAAAQAWAHPTLHSTPRRVRADSLGTAFLYGVRLDTTPVAGTRGHCREWESGCAVSAVPKCPNGLETAGKTLWKAVLADLPALWEFDRRELAILGAACRQADTVSALDAAVAADGVMIEGAAGQRRLNAAVTELRQGRIAVARLLGELDMPADDGRPVSASSQRARHAAAARWVGHAARKASGDG